MATEGYNLKIHFYGVQGSGSVFPSRTERHAVQEFLDLRLLDQVFADLARRLGPDGRIGSTIEEILGGAVNRQTLAAYRRRFEIEEPRVYGGWTTCVRVEAGDGHEFVFDLGSGFRNCAADLQRKWAGSPQRSLCIFGSHSHFDHIEGFDQAAVCFDPRNRIRVFGNRQYLRALDQNLGIFSHQVDASLLGVHTPLNYAVMPARFESCEIRDLSAAPPAEAGSDRLAHTYHDLGQPLQIGATRITAFEVFHPAPCFAYRIEHGGKVFIFCTDHEYRRGADPADRRQQASLAAEARLRQHAQGADLMYRDGQYFQAEYDGHQGIGNAGGVPRIDWGHSCIEDVVDMAEACQVKSTLIGHHDPNRDWSERNWIDDTLTRKGEQIGFRLELARAETTVTL